MCWLSLMKDMKLKTLQSYGRFSWGNAGLFILLHSSCFLIEMAFPVLLALLENYLLFNSTAATIFCCVLFFILIIICSSAVFIFKVYCYYFFWYAIVLASRILMTCTLLEVSQLLYMVVILCYSDVIPTSYYLTVRSRAFWDSTTWVSYRFYKNKTRWFFVKEFFFLNTEIFFTVRSFCTTDVSTRF
jgi:hypothetical protein